MKDKKRTLRVAVKLMTLIMMGFLLYVFFVGLIGEAEQAKSLLIDVSEIAPGKATYFDAGKRKLMVLHRTPEQIASMKNAGQQQKEIYRSVRPQYFVAWAYDPFFGCDIEYQQVSFKAVCVDKHYDLAGRVLKGGDSDKDLMVPDYQFEDEFRISVKVGN